ncbi:MAG: hypothetical protein IT537_25305 [Hyphomicrobiales bacterium]|nr:hypothetical protein [Hyphomicrobiales bacterium]
MSTEQTTSTPAPAADTTGATGATGATGVSDRAGLVGLFAAELDNEDKATGASGASGPSGTETRQATPATETPDQPGDAATTEQDSAPGDGTGAEPASDAPSGMSEADRALWAQLSPEMQSWVSRREQESRSDYTRKTQAVAEQRRHAEAAAQQLMGQLQHYDAILSQITNREIAPPPLAMRNTDPLGYDEQMAAYVTAKHQQEVAAAEQHRVRGEARQLETQHKQQWYAQQATELQQLAPELAAPTTAGKQLRESVFKYAKQAGYSDDLLAGASARDMVTLWKASQYDAGKASRANVRPVPQAAPKTITPGPAKAPSRAGTLAAAVTNLSQKGSRDALADAYLAQLNSEH